MFFRVDGVCPVQLQSLSMLQLSLSEGGRPGVSTDWDEVWPACPAGSGVAEFSVVADCVSAGSAPGGSAGCPLSGAWVSDGAAGGDGGESSGFCSAAGSYEFAAH